MKKWNWYVKQYEYENEDECKSDFSIHEVSEYKKGKLDPLYGIQRYNITDADIEALKSGKLLYTTINDDEYAIVIGLGSAIDDEIAQIFQKEDPDE